MSVTLQPFLLPEPTLRKVRVAAPKRETSRRRRKPAMDAARQTGLPLHSTEITHTYVLKTR